MLIHRRRRDQMFHAQVPGLVAELTSRIHKDHVANPPGGKVIGEQLPHRLAQARTELGHRRAPSHWVRRDQDAKAVHQQPAAPRGGHIDVAHSSGCQTAGGDGLVPPGSVDSSQWLSHAGESRGTLRQSK